MYNRIGLLLPRSTDYPSMGFDLLDGLRSYLKITGNEAASLFTENIGFGTDPDINYSKAEKLLLQDNVDLVIAYSSPSNAEPFYRLADGTGKPFLIVDMGMQTASETGSPHCYHISFQGIHACRILGNMAGSGNRKVLMATSFYDGGYRGPWSYDRGLSEAGGSICGNYVSGFKEAEFTIDPYIGLLHQSGAASVAACFSSYLAELFLKALAQRNAEAVPLPFYCSPFMAEDQLLSKCVFPGGEFYTVVPWTLSLDNAEQEQFKGCIGQNKPATIFHLLGWEAGIAVTQASQNGIQSLKGFSYESPRGKVTIHPETRYTYAPLYKGQIRAGGDGKCRVDILETIMIDAPGHVLVLNDKPDALVSGWRNNYLCI
jgi:branched-chain amino acid transport system substrate-binding protein